MTRQATGESLSRELLNHPPASEIDNEDNHQLLSKSCEGSDSSMERKHWYWDNWIMLALSSAVCFTIRELMIGEFSQIGMQGLFYYASGPLPFCVAYFILRKEW